MRALLVLIATLAGCGASVPPSAALPASSPATSPATPSTSPTTSPPTPSIGGSWSTGPPLPERLGEVSAAVLDGKLYVAGGFGLRQQQSAAFYRFDPATETWTALAPLPEPRDHAQLSGVDGQLYLTGGNAGRSRVGRTSGGTTPAPIGGPPWRRCPTAARRMRLPPLAARSM